MTEQCLFQAKILINHAPARKEVQSAFAFLVKKTCAKLLYSVSGRQEMCSRHRGYADSAPMRKAAETVSPVGTAEHICTTHRAPVKGRFQDNKTL